MAHLFVTECRVKILLHALHQSGAVDIDHHIIAARFDPRKRHREEVGQEGPREIGKTNRTWLKREPKSRTGCNCV